MTSAHDLNSKRKNAKKFLTTGNSAGRWRMHYACRGVGFCAAHGVSAEARVQLVCAALRRRSAIARVLVSRSVFVFGVCSVDVPREPAGHRDLSAGEWNQAVSCGPSGTRFAEHAGRCQPRSRLADLCRLRPSPDSPARKLYAQDTLAVALEHAAYALDSTTIDLC